MIFNPQPKQEITRLTGQKLSDFKRSIIDRDNYACINPQCPTRGNDFVSPIACVLSVHHHVKLSQGGQDITSNAVTLCAMCHDLIHRHKIDDSFVEEYLKCLYDTPTTDGKTN